MAKDKNLDLEALQTLMQAVRTYRETLSENYVILQNAAEACDQAMGSGFIIQKYLSSYNAGLAELSKTISLAAQVSQELGKEWKAAISIQDSLGV